MATSKKAPRAVRLTIRYDQGRLQVIGRQSVQMIVPPAESPPPGAPAPGLWCEVKDAQDQSLYRRSIGDPFPESAELFPEDPRGAIRRVAHAEAQGVFTLLVPELAEGVAVTLSTADARLERRAGLAARAAGGAAVEIARFDLREGR